MLKRVLLGAADRLVINSLTSALKQAGIEEARHVREIRRCFDLRIAAKNAERLSKFAEEAGLPSPTWDEMADPSEAIQDAQIAAARAAREAEPDLSPKSLIDAIERYVGLLRTVANGEKDYTIDDVYLRWLQEQLNKKDWTKVNATGPDGKMIEVDVAVAPSLMEAVANAADKIADALAAPGLTE